MSSDLVYLYAITGADGLTVSSSETVEGRPLRTIAEGDLVALVSDVPAAEFEQSALDENVRNGEWLTPQAAAHSAVNAATHGTVAASLPVPFGTIFRSDERVREMLRTRAAELAARLQTVRGRSEWVVGLYRDTPRAAEHVSRVREAEAARDAVATGGGPGRRYLEQRKREGELREDLRRLDADAQGAADAALRSYSDRVFEEPVMDEQSDLVARTTYLVPRSSEDDFYRSLARTNDEWRDRGYELRATGPWPAYRSSGVTL